MNILLISAVFPPEPVVSAKLSADIAHFLSDSENVTVISPVPSRPFGFKLINDNIPLSYKHITADSYICPQSRLFGRIYESISFGRFCYRFIIKNYSKIDIIYANTWPFFGQYYVVKAAKKFRIPVVVHIQDIYPESLTNKIPLGNIFLKPILLPLEKYVLRNSQRIIAISERMKNYLIRTRKILPDSIYVIPNWQNENDFSCFQTMTIPEEKDFNFTFMYLGNIGPVAGVELLIEAFADAGLDRCRLVIAGSGSMLEVLKNKVKEMDAVNIFFWSVPEGKVAEIQSKADVLLLPVKKGAALSSIPSKLPAYMFSAKPVIACIDDESDTADAIREANCGWILPPEDSKLLSDFFKKVVLMQKTELINLGENGLNHAKLNFSRKNNLPGIISIILNASQNEGKIN